MKIEESKGLLKNGEEYIIRNIDVSDAKGLLEHYKQVPYDSNFFLLTKKEAEEMSLERMETSIKGYIASEYLYFYPIFVNNKLVGAAYVSINNNEKEKHRGSIGISINKEYWGVGCGSILFDEMIKQAKKINLHQLELAYIEGNERGFNLYSKKGFKIYSELEDAVYDGKYLKEIFMVKKL